MDNLALLKQLRADVPEPDPATLRRIRDGILAALPADAPASPPPAWWAPRGLTLRLAVAAALVVAVVLGTVVVDSLTEPDGRPLLGHDAAAAELTRAAGAAFQASDPPLAPGQFFYVRTVGLSASEMIGDPDCPDLLYLRKSVFEIWVPANWSDQWMQRRDDNVGQQFLHSGDEQKLAKCPDEPATGPEVRKAPAGMFYPDSGVDNPNQPRDPSGAIVAHPGAAEIARHLANGTWQVPTPPFLAALPRDPRALLARVYHDAKGHGRSPDDEAFVYITDLLRTGVVPADLRAALFGAAALIPGVGLASNSVNLDGRHGVAIATSAHDGTREELIIDPASGDVIGERTVAISPRYFRGVAPGTTIGSSAVTRQVVDVLGAVPGK